MAPTGKLPSKKPSRKVAARTVFGKKERALLINSRAIDDYVDWRLLLAEGPLTAKAVDQFTPEQRSFVSHVLPKLVMQAAKEWKIDRETVVEDLKEDRRPCTLCDTPTRYIFYIKNQLNGNRMNVGSECIRQFEIDISGAGMSIEQLIRRAARVRRISELDAWFPGIESILEDWVALLDRQPFLIPKRIEHPYRELGTRTRDLFERYVNPERKVDGDPEEYDKQLLDAVAHALTQRATFLAEIDTFGREARENRFSVPRSMVRWLVQRDDRQTIDWLKADEAISERTAWRIPEPEFMNAIARDLEELLKAIGMTMARIEASKAQYVLRPTKWPDILIAVRHGDLLMQCGRAIFSAEPSGLTLSYLIENGNIADRRSRDAALGELGQILRPHGLAPVEMSQALPGMPEEDVSDLEAYFDEWVLHERATNKFIVVDKLDMLANEFRALVFGIGGKTAAEMRNSVASPSVRRFTGEELKRDYHARLRARRDSRI